MENGKKEIMLEVNLWPTKTNPWVCRVNETVEKEVLYKVAKELMWMVHAPVTTPPPHWLPPRYVRIRVVIEGESVRIIEMVGGRVWRWPSLWRPQLTEQVAFALQACYVCG